MGSLKPRGKYQAISLPVEFIEEMKEFVDGNKKYRSIAELARQAIREKIYSEKNPWLKTIDDPENKKLYDAEIWGDPKNPEDGFIKKVEPRPQLEDRIKKVEEKLDTLIQVLSKDNKIGKNGFRG